MTEARDDDRTAAPIGVAAMGQSAGALLRAGREQRGVHIAALAAAIKVPQRKLEALEADRYDELPDLTFTRALAQSVCRHLKLELQPVLDRLPQTVAAPQKLVHVGSGLATPFRERPGREAPADWGWLSRPVVWGTLLVLLAAVVLALVPGRWLELGSRTRLPAAAPASAPPAAEPAASPVVMTPPLSPTAAVEPSPAAGTTPGSAPAGAPAAVLALKASAETWVEVQDAAGQLLLQRKVAPGEALSLESAELPLRLTIGNASATQLSFRGQPVDLSANTLGNVARLQLD
jgi:cytoskeleton protein RodZ